MGQRRRGWASPSGSLRESGLWPRKGPGLVAAAWTRAWPARSAWLRGPCRGRCCCQGSRWAPWAGPAESSGCREGEEEPRVKGPMCRIGIQTFQAVVVKMPRDPARLPRPLVRSGDEGLHGLPFRPWNSRVLGGPVGSWGEMKRKCR